MTSVVVSAPASSASLFPGRAAWLTVLTVTVIDAAWIARSARLSLQWHSALLPAATLVLSLLVAKALGTLGPRLPWPRVTARIRVAVEGVAFIATGFAALRLFSHLMMTLDIPLADDRLAAWDGALGLDWIAYASWFAARPWARLALALSYQGISLTALLAYLVLIAAGRIARARELAVLLTGTSLTVSIVAAWFPAMGSVATLGDGQLRTIFQNGMYFVEPLTTVRSGIPHAFDLGNLVGLCSFPSFHTVTGLLIAWAFRASWAIVPAGAYSATMIAATPLFGGHFFVDLIAGAALTIAAVLAYGWIAGDYTAGREARKPSRASIG